MEKKIYLDNNASTPLDPQVLQEMIELLKSYTGNPSSIHSFGRALQQKLVLSRDIIANYLKVRSKEIVFTSGATEGINMLLKGFFREQPRKHIISSNLEHSCVYNTLKFLESQGAEVTYLSPGKYGAAKLDEVKEALRPDTGLIVLMSSNNETGVKTDISEIAFWAQNLKIPFIVDYVSSFGKEPLVLHDGVSAACFSGHKIHGPKGVGFTFIKRNFKLPSFIHGGGHENGLRAGTENISGIVGLATAVSLLSGMLPGCGSHMEKLRDYFEKELLASLPDVFINGEGPRVCNTSNLAFSGVEGEVLLAKLDMEGIAVSHGSACSSGALEPSRILLNMGIPVNLARSSVRFSLNRMTTMEEISKALEIIVKIVNNLRR